MSAEVAELAQNIARHLGWAVFPCGWESKAPTRPKSEGGNGFKDATRDPDEIAELWRRWPGELIGIVTGQASGINVLDIDAKHPIALKWWEAATSRLETTPTALAIRSSISRAITSLLKRGMLAYRPYCSNNGDYERFGRTYGYVLTAAGLAAGLPHEPTVPDLALRLWLMDDNFQKTWWIQRPIPPITQAYCQIGITEGCQAPRFLPAPGCAAVPDEFQSHPLRYVRPAATRPVVTLSPVRVDPAALGVRIRELAVQNDPDVLREGLAALAAELDAEPAP